MDARIRFNAKKIGFVLLISVFLGGALLPGCGWMGSQPPATQTPQVDISEPDDNPYPSVEAVFNVHIPLGTGEPAEVFIDLLDEVTGLALNPTRYPMQHIEGTNYSVRVSIPLGSVVKYRYSRQGEIPAIEYNTHNQQVRYRLARVDGPIVIDDIVPAWMDKPYDGETGRITGTTLDRDTGNPIPNLMVCTAGLITFSTSDGSFVLEEVPVGTHTLVVYAMDGAYSTFQQGANVAAGSTTPAVVSLDRRPTVEVTFQVTIPIENIVGVPVRLAGNFYQTGNTFADLDGGINVITSRMPLLTQNANGAYSLTLTLPAGADFQYKYTLGDGFWNAEHTSDGAMRIRQLIVPQEDMVLEDTVASWRSGNFAPVTIEVAVPENTPQSDYVSIQFNPYGWTEPIPMWSLGGNRWMYTLFNPFNVLGEVQYRFCRNDQCGVADDMQTMGDASSPYRFSPSDQPQSLKNQVDRWGWWEPTAEPTSVLAAEVLPRGPSFMTGVEMQADYHPSMQSRYGVAVQALKDIGAGWVIFTPTWTYTYLDPVVLDPVPGTDPFWPDIAQGIQQTRSAGLHAAIFPVTATILPEPDWWELSSRDTAWWEGWFNRYRTFILHHADLAATSQAEALILGGASILPALPDGRIPDGTPSGVPLDAAARWTDLLQEVRNRYPGTVLWAVPFQEDGSPMPDFVSMVDQIYLLWSPSLSADPVPSESNFEAEMERLFSSHGYTRVTDMGKPVILAAASPSLEGSSTGCPAQDPDCWLISSVADRPTPGAVVNLQDQVRLYNAIFSAVNHHEEIVGVVSRGMYFPAPLQDPSASVYGKPAWDVLWYWFPQLVEAP